MEKEKENPRDQLTPVTLVLLLANGLIDRYFHEPQVRIPVPKRQGIRYIAPTRRWNIVLELEIRIWEHESVIYLREHRESFVFFHLTHEILEEPKHFRLSAVQNVASFREGASLVIPILIRKIQIIQHLLKDVDDLIRRGTFAGRAYVARHRKQRCLLYSHRP